MCTELQNTVDNLENTVKGNLSKVQENGQEINQLYQSLAALKGENGQLTLSNKVLDAFNQDMRRRTGDLTNFLVVIWWLTKNFKKNTSIIELGNEIFEYFTVPY